MTYYQKHKKRINAYYREYYKTHKNQIKAKCNEYYQANREHYLTLFKATNEKTRGKRLLATKFKQISRLTSKVNYILDLINQTVHEARALNEAGRESQ